MKKAVFMDRDGTLSFEVGYVNHISRFKLYPFTPQAIKLLNESDYLAICVTNQAGVARGYFEESLVKEVHKKMQNCLKKEGAYLDDIFYCPHHPTAGGNPDFTVECNCRKPKPGMLLDAAKKHNIDLTQSFVIGDKITDVELAKKVGAKGIMVMTGYGRGEYEYQRNNWKVFPDYIAENLLEAVKWILQNS